MDVFVLMFCVMRLPRLIAKNKTSARHSLTLNVWLVKHARHSFRIPGIPFAEKLFCNASEEICPPVAINPARGLAAIPQRQPPQLPDAPDRAGGLSDGLSPFPDGNGSSCGRAAAGASAALVGLGYGFRRGTDSAPAGASTGVWAYAGSVPFVPKFFGRRYSGYADRTPRMGAARRLMASQPG